MRLPNGLTAWMPPLSRALRKTADVAMILDTGIVGGTGRSADFNEHSTARVARDALLKIGIHKTRRRLVRLLRDQRRRTALSAESPFYCNNRIVFRTSTARRAFIRMHGGETTKAPRCPRCEGWHLR